jgi:deoxyribodipyrimidine photo-lyase
MKFELLWREYFKWLEIKFGARMYTLQNIKGCKLNHQWNPELFRMWCNAQTGDALTDAGMQELIQTGYTSNRARQNMASYLIHELQLPWIAGAQWFEHHLVDYDPGSNYGNWAYIAGCGCTPGPSRKFNTQKQKDTYDPDGTYLAKWSKAN